MYIFISSSTWLIDGSYSIIFGCVLIESFAMRVCIVCDMDKFVYCFRFNIFYSNSVSLCFVS